MKYFLDSAKIDEIKYAYENWGIDGVTSNPKHVLTSGKTFAAVVKELAEEFKDTGLSISVEVNPHLEKADDMISEARKLANISDNFAIKIPCTEQGLIAAKKLVEEGIRVNLTLVFTASQALQAGRVGCAYVSPFIGWQEASGVDCTQLISDIVAIYEIHNIETEIIVAAVRSAKQIVDAAILGVDIVTAGFQVYKDSFHHPFTDKGLKIFQDAWDKTDIEDL
ncbi:MAG: transaldolase family protein [Candidatus Hodarchaeota archaeon]